MSIKVNFEKLKSLNLTYESEEEILQTIKDNIEYFVGYGCGHNKNLTNRQFHKLDDIYDLLKCLSIEKQEV